MGKTKLNKSGEPRRPEEQKGLQRMIKENFVNLLSFVTFWFKLFKT